MKDYVVNLRIGVDARSLSKKLTGIGYYCWNLLKKLDKYPNVHFVLFSASSLQIPKNILTNVTYVENSLSNPFLKQIWFDLFLPTLIKRYHINIFWGPSHCIPLFLNKNIPSVLTIHDLVWKYFPETLAKGVLLREKFHTPISLKQANIILSSSEHTKKDLTTHYPFCASRIRIAPPAADDFPITPENDFHTFKKPYILFVGTREPRKNLVRLLHAYASLSHTIHQKFSLIIVGEAGWGNIQLEQEIIKYNLQEYISCLGYVDQLTLKKLYQHAYCLAIPSLYEGFGRPIVEAQRYGIPVLTSNISSMPEVAGKGAILVNPYSVTSIRDGLKKLLTNESLRNILSQKSLLQIKRYSWNKTAKIIYQAFQDAHYQKLL